MLLLYQRIKTKVAVIIVVHQYYDFLALLTLRVLMILFIKYLVNAMLFASLLIVPLISPKSFAQQTFLSEQQEPVANFSSVQLSQISNDLRYYDEVLTSSVLNYAFYGEQKWLDRYNENEPQLSFLINKLLEQNVDEALAPITTLKKTHDLLFWNVCVRHSSGVRPTT